MEQYRITIDQSMSRAGELVVEAESREAARAAALRRAKAQPDEVDWQYGEDGDMEIVDVEEAGPSFAETKARELVSDVVAGEFVWPPFRSEVFAFTDEFGNRQVVTHEVNTLRRLQRSVLSVEFTEAGEERELSLDEEAETALRRWVDAQLQARMRAHACNFEAEPCQQCERYHALGLPCIACSGYGEICALDGDPVQDLERGECQHCGRVDLLFLYRDIDDARFCALCAMEQVSARREAESS